MFGNLKNKLGDVADFKKYASPQILSSLGGSRQRSTQQSPGSETPSLSQHSRQPSDASIPGTNTHVGPMAISTVSEQNEIIRELNDENNLYDDPENENLKTELKKVKTILENHQDIALQKLITREQQWKTKLSEEHAKLLCLEEKLKGSQNNEEDLRQKIADKETENAACVESVSEKEDLSQRLEGLHDDYDELEGFSVQEAAKVKHLQLLNTTSALEEALAEASQKTEEAAKLEERLSAAEALEDRVREMGERNTDLDTVVAGLTQKLNAANLKLKCDSEVHAVEIKHLQDRLTLNETNSGDQADSGNFKKQREAYELKLEEVRQQLVNIKSSWSEKILLLESQITNLNENIAENQSEMQSLEEQKTSSTSEVLSLRSAREADVSSHEAQLAALRVERDQLSEDLSSTEWQLRDETAKTQKELLRAHEALKLEKDKSARMSTAEQELSEARNQLDVLQPRLEMAESKMPALQERLDLERADSEAVERQLTALKDKHATTCSERDKLACNLDKYVVTLEEKEVIVAKLMEETEQQKHRLVEADERSRELSERVRYLEDDLEGQVERSDRVEKLKTDLEEALEDAAQKKQMVKVQSQRLASMKRTFQKELKMNPDVRDNYTERNGVSEGSNHTSEKGYVASVPAPSSPPFQNGDIAHSEPVNLEYLKHVVIKFVTSRDYEAVQLTRAMSTLLHLSAAEEKLLRETLEWRMSWFGSRPNTELGRSYHAGQ